LVLTSSETQAFYDRFGEKQDSQGFYEDLALADLLAHGDFAASEAVFEFGCGTGRLAETLLDKHLASSAGYTGCDLSRTMTRLATTRLSKYANRVRLFQSGDAMQFDQPNLSVDRIISTYVLDLLSVSDIQMFLQEASRVLRDDGKLCLVGLTRGVTPLSKVVSGVWNLIFRIRASLVGGCRPICLQQYVSTDQWVLEYRNVLVAFGVPSEVMVIRKS
jgi:ubiquinone/menaquinone biosynthesis C-methylase UbiE